MTFLDPTTTPSSLVSDLAYEVPRRPEHFTLVGVDGVDGSGKTTFARALAIELQRLNAPVVLIHVDDFHNLRAARYRLGRESPEGFWLDSYDYHALRRDVLHPFGPGGNGRYRPIATDLETDSYIRVDQRQAQIGTVAIVEGMFLHRDELAKHWDYSIFLDVPFSETATRMANRDGSPNDPEHPQMRRYVQGQRQYFQTCEPWSRATRIVNNSNWNHPRISSSVTEH